MTILAKIKEVIGGKTEGNISVAPTDQVLNTSTTHGHSIEERVFEHLMQQQLPLTGTRIGELPPDISAYALAGFITAKKGHAIYVGSEPKDVIPINPRKIDYEKLQRVLDNKGRAIKVFPGVMPIYGECFLGNAKNYIVVVGDVDYQNIDGGLERAIVTIRLTREGTGFVSYSGETLGSTNGDDLPRIGPIVYRGLLHPETISTADVKSVLDFCDSSHITLFPSYLMNETVERKIDYIINQSTHPDQTSFRTKYIPALAAFFQLAPKSALQIDVK